MAVNMLHGLWQVRFALTAVEDGDLVVHFKQVGDNVWSRERDPTDE
jgi:hypothetical protein